MEIKYRLTKKIKCPVCALVTYPMSIRFEPLMPIRQDVPQGQWVLVHPCFHTFKISDYEANEHGITARRESLWMKFQRMLNR